LPIMAKYTRSLTPSSSFDSALSRLVARIIHVEAAVEY
jgi:hypothetical protein